MAIISLNRIVDKTAFLPESLDAAQSRRAERRCSLYGMLDHEGNHDLTFSFIEGI